ncbi:MAG: hypothetical protein OQK04_13805, partial [Kangiellaceae bacterium]|nr:hypothetical protein [Kangiellaceae bacterium]
MRRFLILSSLIVLSACSSNPVEELAPFTSDGCSSFPDGTLKQKQLWLDCCVAHDKAYWMGGNYQQRLDADKALESCVEQVGEKAVAKLMLAGVRVGGSPYWPTSFRWGYGWDYTRGYDELTAEEKAYAEKLLTLYEKQQAKEKASS